MMDKTSRLISVLRAESVDPQAKKTADFYRNEIQIREAIAAGWKLINIWKHLKDHNEFSGGYHSFLRYVKKMSAQTSVSAVRSSTQKKAHAKNEKRLVMELAEMTLNIQPSDPRIGQKTLALFLGKQDEIKEAIDAGYRLKTIWKALLEMRAFDASYNCFTWYVRKYLTGEEIESAVTPATLVQEKSEAKPHIMSADKSSSGRNSGTAARMPDKKHTEKASSGFDHFNYNPASIDKDSLI